MSKISKSPNRHTFQRDGYLKRMAEEGRTPENDETVKAMLDYYNSWSFDSEEKETDPSWYENNMEADMRICDWMLEKVRNSDTYAQNLYAAMCNREFQKLEVLPVLKEQTWSCSWRYSGGIIADMRQEGDYIDWYCSGIGGGLGNGDASGTLGYVGEGNVTEEIKEDLQKLGWIVLPNDLDE